MNGLEMKAIRERLGMTREQFARAIGYTGTDRNNVTRVRKYEHGAVQIPLYIARLVWLTGQIAAQSDMNLILGNPDPKFVDEDGLPDWPKWPGYDFVSQPDPQEATDGAVQR
jgi:transcriptional regulator with XRE-family HTH domain